MRAGARPHNASPNTDRTAYTAQCVTLALATFPGPPVELTKHSFRDVVLWNIGGDKAAGMADLGPGEWERYLCLEAGAVGSPVRVLPGDTFAAGQTLSSSCAAAEDG